MPWDSLVRTKQVNKPEFSGYIVDVLLQYLKTGAVTGIAMNTGQLTGQFYPLRQNPSGYVTTGQLTGYATRQEVTGNNIAVLSYVETNYYPRSNPSGFITSGQTTSWINKTGAAWLSSEPDFQLIDIAGGVPFFHYRPDEFFYLQAFGSPNWAKIWLGGLSTNPYISGFDIWTTGFNGYPALSSGNINNLYVHRDYFDEAHADFAHTLPFVTFYNNNPNYNGPFFYFGSGTYTMYGGRSGAPSELYFIDMLGTSAPAFGLTYNRPTIYGLDIVSSSIRVTGYNVLTTSDLSGLATRNELYTASGTLNDDIDRLRTEIYEIISGESGIYQFSGTGGIVVIQSGLSVIISGQGGNSNFNDTGQYVWTTGANQSIRGVKTFQSGAIIRGLLTVYDSGSAVSLDGGTRVLYDTSEYKSIDWENRILHGAGDSIIVDWSNYVLYASGPKLNWGQRQLSGVWSAGGLTISGNPVLTGQYVMVKATTQNLSGIFNVASGRLRVSGQDVVTGGPYYPRGSNPSGYMTHTGVIYNSSDFDPDFFLEYSGLAVAPIVDIGIEDGGGYLGIEQARYWLFVQGYKTGVDGRIVYSPIVSSGYYDNLGNNDMLLNWNPLPAPPFNQQYLLHIKSQVYGGGVPYGKFQTGGYAWSTDDKNGINYSSLAWSSGYHSGWYGPFSALPGYVTWTGQYVRSLEVTGQELSGQLKLTGIGGLQISVSGNTVIFSGGAAGPGGITGPYVSGVMVTGQYQTGLVTITGLGGVAVGISGTIITVSGGSNVLGLPTDGAYGGSNGPIAGVTQGDRNEDAFDKVEVVLGKLAPSKPLSLSQATFGFTGTTYSAYMQGTTTVFSSVMNNLQPTGYATGFYDADAGILSGYINNTFTGVRTLWTGSDIGTYSGLRITNEFDYWAGTPGRAGFWNCINAQLSPMIPANTGVIVMRMGHSQQGMTAAITGYCDTPKAPSSAWLASGTGIGMCTFRWTDGIISLANADSVFVRFSGMGGVFGPFYNSSQVARLTSTHLATTNVSATGLPMSGNHQTLSGYMTVNNGAYVTGASITLTTYNSAGTTNAYATSTYFYIDTVSSQQAQRHTAGTGRFISGGFNLNYDNTVNLSGNEELQMINGLIQNPPKVNYGVFTPSGRNYGYIQTGLYSGCRWAMFDMGPITAASSVQLTFASTNNFGATPVISDFLLYVRVSGAGTNGTAGWVNGNAAYPGVGNPTLNDDPALVIGSSSATVKTITFGTATLTGPVYIRVGLPSGSNKSFGSVSMAVA